MSIPDYFKCPISWTLMRDPVIGPDEHTYEGSSLQKTLATKAVSPKTRQPMTWAQCRSNRALKEAIEDYLTQHPEMASERTPPTLAEIKKGEFDEHDVFRPDHFTQEEWGKLMKDSPEQFKKMKIVDYNQPIKDTIEWYLLLVAVRKNLKEMARWLYPKTQIMISNVWRYPDKPGYKFRNSPLVEAIRNRNPSLIKFFLEKEVGLLSEAEVADMIQNLPPYQSIELLTPYQKHLKSLNWDKKITSYVSAQNKVYLRASLITFILKYAQNVAQLDFFRKIKPIPKTAGNFWILLAERKTTQGDISGLIHAFLVRGKKPGKLIQNPTPKSEEALTSVMKKFTEEERASWDYHLVQSGLVEKMIEAQWIPKVGE